MGVKLLKKKLQITFTFFLVKLFSIILTFNSAATLYIMDIYLLFILFF